MKMYLEEQFAKGGVEAHKIPSLDWHNIYQIQSQDICSCSAHSGFYRLARRVHKQLGEPFKDALDLSWLRLSQIFR